MKWDWLTSRAWPKAFVEVASLSKEQADAEPQDAVLASLRSMDRRRLGRHLVRLDAQV